MITVVYGTRPEAIKLAPVVEELRSRSSQVRVICTGQHQELLDAVALKADLELDLMEINQTPAVFIARTLKRLDEEISGEWVVVQGDTATAFAAALVAFHKKIPIAHVEAGLRTYDLEAPFPEEGYRQMVDRIATRLYAPTMRAKMNLIQEGRLAQDIKVTGNTGIDAAMRAGLGKSHGQPPFILVTIHRREAFGEPIENVCRALLRIAQTTNLHVVLPMHPNPNVRSTLERMLAHEQIHLIAPLNYRDLLATLCASMCVVTDSGGIQEEAPTFGIPILVTRATTERQEAIEAGAAKFVGFDEDAIVREVTRLHTEPHAREKMAVQRHLFGDGLASQRIADDLLGKSHDHQ